MSLWYNSKKGEYASDGKSGWIKAYCDKALSELSAKLSGHFDASAYRHAAEDIDYDDTTVKEKIESIISENDSEYSELSRAISSEAAARKSADSDLSERIDSEEAARESADSDLSGRIDSEEAAREAADSDLSGRIDSEEAAREAADSDLSGRIDSEADAREAADNELSEALSAKVPLYNSQSVTTENLAELATQRGWSYVLFKGDAENAPSGLDEDALYYGVMVGKSVYNSKGSTDARQELSLIIRNTDDSVSVYKSVFTTSGTLNWTLIGQSVYDSDAGTYTYYHMNRYYGFTGGKASNAGTGAAIGWEASAERGGAVGTAASAENGGAVGDDATTESGGSLGEGAKSDTGAAIGCNAQAEILDDTYGGGVAAGENAHVVGSGAALGNGAEATDGGVALGRSASTESGASIGSEAESKNGFAGGYSAKSTGMGSASGATASAYHGGAVGYAAEAQNGFAGGSEAKCGSVDCIQLGSGTNGEENSLQIYERKLMTGRGYIPAARSLETSSRYIDWKLGQSTETDTVNADCEVVRYNGKNALHITSRNVFYTLDETITSGTVTFSTDVYIPGIGDESENVCRIYLENENSTWWQDSSNSLSSVIAEVINIGADDEIFGGPGLNPTTQIGSYNAVGWYTITITIDYDNVDTDNFITLNVTDPNGNDIVSNYTMGSISGIDTSLSRIRLISRNNDTYFANMSGLSVEDRRIAALEERIAALESVISD